MPLPVSLRAVAGEIDAGSDEMTFYISRKTGETVMIFSDHDVGGIDEDEHAADVARVQGSDEFVALPQRATREAYRLMEDFCQSLPEGRVRGNLLDAISGKGAFARFKNGTIRLGVRDAWHVFKEKADARFAREFLDEEGIPYVDDVGLGEAR